MPPETAAQLNFQTLQSLLQQMRSRTAITGEPADGVTLTEVDDGIPGGSLVAAQLVLSPTNRQ